MVRFETLANATIRDASAGSEVVIADTDGMQVTINSSLATRAVIRLKFSDGSYSQNLTLKTTFLGNESQFGLWAPVSGKQTHAGNAGVADRFVVDTTAGDRAGADVIRNFEDGVDKVSFVSAVNGIWVQKDTSGAQTHTIIRNSGDAAARQHPWL